MNQQAQLAQQSNNDDDLKRISDEIAALTPEQLREELTKIRARQRLQQEQLNLPTEPLKPEELTREDLVILARSDVGDDPYSTVECILDGLMSDGKWSINIEDQREWYKDLYEEDKEGALDFTHYIFKNRRPK